MAKKYTYLVKYSFFGGGRAGTVQEFRELMRPIDHADALKSFEASLADIQGASRAEILSIALMDLESVTAPKPDSVKPEPDAA